MGDQVHIAYPNYNSPKNGSSHCSSRQHWTETHFSPVVVTIDSFGITFQSPQRKRGSSKAELFYCFLLLFK